jgi:dTDP-4-dehydrorhamnose reductase
VTCRIILKFVELSDDEHRLRARAGGNRVMSGLPGPVLVFGAGGQVGCELLQRFQWAAVPVVGLTHAHADICDPTAVSTAIERHRPAVIVNAAGYTAVDKAEADDARAFAVNVEGAGNLARAAATFGAPLIHLSTDYVFDGRKGSPYVEDDPVSPINVYGRSKEAGERAVRAEGPRHIILRTAWLYGGYGQNFAKTMLRLATERDVVRVVADQHGTPTSTADIAEAIFAIIARCADDASAFGTFHLTNAGETTWHGFAARIFQHLAARGSRTARLDAITTAEYETPAVRPKNCVLCCDRIRQVHSIVPRSWDAVLDDALPLIAGASSSTKRGAA